MPAQEALLRDLQGFQLYRFAQGINQEIRRCHKGPRKGIHRGLPRSKKRIQLRDLLQQRRHAQSRLQGVEMQRWLRR